MFIFARRKEENDMIQITFPDGSIKEFEQGITGMEIAKSISERLAKEVLSISVNGQVQDLARPIEENATIKLFKFEDNEGKHTFWHSSAHLLAEALQAIYPNIKFGIGPAIDNGFYYDVDPGEGTTIKDEDLPAIEEKMKELAKKSSQYVRENISKADALKLFGDRGETYKVELINDLADGTISLYKQGDFTDLCRGPHLPSTEPIKAVKLLNVAGAY